MTSEVPEVEERLRLLRGGEVALLGRMPWSSNATYLVSVSAEGVEARAVYKPGRGERPLWDFPGGLYRREVAAYELSVATGLRVVPETVLRDDLQLGAGSLQWFIDADFSQHYFTLLEGGRHEEALRLVAGFDLLANNADRKGGHLLVDAEDRVWGIDNGLCFHASDKLRTVMWDFAGEALPGAVLEACDAVAGGPPAALAALLSPEELVALCVRAERYLERRSYPAPGDDHRYYPWPLV